MKLRQIWLERIRLKLGLKAVKKGKQTRVSVESSTGLCGRKEYFTGLDVQFYMST